MGFRHGPKSIINDKTLVVMWLSSDNYTRQYEMDFLEELYHDVGDFKVMAVSAYKDENVAKLADYTFFVDENETSAWGKYAYIALDYVLFDHLLALKALMGKRCCTRYTLSKWQCKSCSKRCYIARIKRKLIYNNLLNCLLWVITI